MTEPNRSRCAELLADCGQSDEGVVLLCKSREEDGASVPKIAAMLARVDEWSGLYEWLRRLRRSAGFETILADVAPRISAQLRKDIESKDACHLLNTALALAAASEKPVADSELVSAVLKRSRRTIRQFGRGEYPLLEEACKKHLALCPEDREVRRRFVRALLARGGYGEARAELLFQMKCDPHDEGMWSDLSKCCAMLGLSDEASVAESRSRSLTPSGIFDTAEVGT
jgi:Flp pilus assembly protein TadD